MPPSMLQSTVRDWRAVRVTGLLVRGPSVDQAEGPRNLLGVDREVKGVVLLVALGLLAGLREREVSWGGSSSLSSDWRDGDIITPSMFAVGSNPNPSKDRLLL